MKKWIALISLSVLVLFVSGCSIAPQAPKKPIIDHTLPKVEQIKYLTDMTEIGFEWQAIRDSRVAGFYIYRSNPQEQTGRLPRLATINDRHVARYSDRGLKPGTQYHYRFSTFSEDKKESALSEMITVTTRPLIESVSFVKAIRGLPNRIKIIWRPHSSQRVVAYVIERSSLGSTDWERLSRVEGRLSAEYIDSELESNRVYRYRVKVETHEGVLSLPSKVVEASTKSLPIEIKNLKATMDVPKKIILTWDPAVEEDFSYYKVYRAINPLLFFNYLAKTRDTRYEDLINENGKSYYYLVTAVDKDGLESPKQQNAVMGSSLAAPSIVYITSLNHDGRSINITWQSKDNRAVKYNVIKEYKGKTKVFTGIKESSFTDSDVVAGVEYKYNIVAIDKFGLTSRESENIVIEIPKD